MLRRYRATPLRPVTYLAASIAVYLLVTLLGMPTLVLGGITLLGTAVAARLFRWE